MVPVMDVRDDLEKIVCPTLVIMTAGVGRRSLESYKKWQPRIKNSELLVVEGDAWHAAGAYPDRCAQATVAFMKRHRQRR
jgi:3-oxoadipate enol-lactonase